MKRLFSRSPAPREGGGVRTVRIPRLALPVAAALVAGVGLVPVAVAASAPAQAAAQAAAQANCWQTTTQFATVLSQVTLGRDTSHTATVVAQLDSKAFGAARRDFAKADTTLHYFTGFAFTDSYETRGRTDVQIVRDIVEAVLHRRPTSADYQATLGKMKETTWHRTKIKIVLDANAAEIDGKLGRLCSASEATAVPPAYTPGPDVDPKKCWQTTNQFIDNLWEATRGLKPWQGAGAAAAALNATPYGAARANAAKTQHFLQPFDAAYTARNRTDRQLVRDIVEAGLNRAPTLADYDAIVSLIETTTDLQTKVKRALAAIDTQLTANLQRLCAPSEANPEPAKHVVGSDVPPNGIYWHLLDSTTPGVKWRSEVRAVGNTDAKVSGWSFSGTEPTLETTFTLTGLTGVGKHTVGDIQVGTRLAAQPEAPTGSTAAAPSILVHVQSVTGTGDSRTISGRVMQLPEMIRSGSLNLSGAVNTAIPAAVTRVMNNEALARTREEVGSFYKADGTLVPRSAATAGFAAVSTLPSVWFSTTPDGALCLNGANLGTTVSVADSSKTQADAAAKAQAIKDRVAVAELPNGAARGDFKLTAGASVKLDEIQGCTKFSAQNWSVDKTGIKGQITQTTSSKVHLTAALNVTGTMEIGGAWKILEEEIFVPVPIPATPIVVPTHLKPSATAPFSASLTGTANLTYAYGNQVTDQVTQTSVDSGAFPFITQISTPGARSDYGVQTRGATGSITGTLKASVAPALAWTFGSWGSKATIGQMSKITPNLPDWLRQKPGGADNETNLNPLADGLVKISAALAVPELSAAITATKGAATPCTTVTLTPTFALKATIALSAGEGFFKLLGITPPTLTIPWTPLAIPQTPIPLWTEPKCATPSPSPGSGTCNDFVPGKDPANHNGPTLPPGIADCTYGPGVWKVSSKLVATCYVPTVCPSASWPGGESDDVSCERVNKSGSLSTFTRSIDFGTQTRTPAWINVRSGINLASSDGTTQMIHPFGFSAKEYVQGISANDYAPYLYEESIRRVQFLGQVPGCAEQ